MRICIFLLTQVFLVVFLQMSARYPSLKRVAKDRGTHDTHHIFELLRMFYINIAITAVMYDYNCDIRVRTALYFFLFTQIFLVVFL